MGKLKLEDILILILKALSQILKKSEIAIFNVPEYEGSNNFAAESHCNVRAAFYSFYHDNLPSICDLGV